MSSPQKCAPIGLDFIKQRFHAALTSFVGRGRPYSVDLLSARTGVPSATIQDHASGRTTPGLHHLVAYCRELPEDFTSAVIEPAGLYAAPLPERGPSDGEMLAGVGALAGEVCQAMADGRIDHREAAKIAPIASQVAGTAAAFANRRHR